MTYAKYQYCKMEQDLSTHGLNLITSTILTLQNLVVILR